MYYIMVTFRSIIVSILLFPVQILLMWGPVTHLYLHKRALEKIDPDSLPDPSLRKAFINASNSTDLIKANNLRHRERWFEYAHNTVPNYFTGAPVMGSNLLDEVEKSGNDPIRHAWALGWLAHQVTDQFAHKIPHAGCEGWVNSRRVLAGYYRPEVDDEPVSVAAARIELYVADHWLAEMLVDCLCYSRERDFIDSFEIDLSIPTSGEILAASRRILDGFEKQLGPGYVYFEPLTDRKLASIVDYYHLIILSLIDLYRAILKSYPDDGFEKYIGSSPRMSRLDELLDNSIDAIIHVLGHPENPWDPYRWLPDGTNDFEHSVYEYERIWRPGRFTFGRKSGLLGWLYYNPLTDRMISKFRDIARTRDFWPLIDLAFSTLYRRGKSQWPIAGAFIRTLIRQKPSSVQDTTAHVASLLNLTKYRETIPD